MFERYNESARRALFFARYEVSGLGALEIGTEHLLLGVMHETRGLVSQILAPIPSSEEIRNEIKSRSTFREETSTSVEVPFTTEAKRALNFAAEEADRLLHAHIGPEHLVLGLLREEKSFAAQTLATYGLRLPEVRLQIVQLSGEMAGAAGTARAPMSEEIDRIESLVQQLGRTPPDTDDARDLVARISDELKALRQHFEKETGA